MKISSSSGAQCVIDGVAYSGNTISISDGVVIVDGVPQEQQLCGSINITVEGNVDTIETGAGDVTVYGSTGNIRTGAGDITCQIVDGNIQTGAGDVRARTIFGDIRTGSGDVNP